MSERFDGRVEKRIDEILHGLNQVAPGGEVSPVVFLGALVRRIVMLELQHEDLKEKLTHIGVYL